MQEQKAMTEALKFSIQMELDGKQFYLKAGQQSNNKLGKELYEWLAAQEDKHRERFESIYNDIVANKGWDESKAKLNKASKPTTIFSQAARQKPTIKADKGEFRAVETAMQMEIKSRDYYQERAAKASSGVEKRFFSTVAAEEQGHYLYLVDYLEYITDPSDWFTRTEHHLLDGA